MIFLFPLVFPYPFKWKVTFHQHVSDLIRFWSAASRKISTLFWNKNKENNLIVHKSFKLLCMYQADFACLYFPTNVHIQHMLISARMIQEQRQPEHRGEMSITAGMENMAVHSISSALCGAVSESVGKYQNCQQNTLHTASYVSICLWASDVRAPWKIQHLICCCLSRVWGE